jgi:transposase
MKMSNYANRYRREFKEEAVRLLLTSGKTAQELGRELGVTGRSLANWKKQALEWGDYAELTRPPAVAIHPSVLELENQRLKKELEIARQERDILKKSLGIRPRARSRKGMP